MAIVSNENILGFEFSINDAIIVKNLDAINNLCNKVPDDIFAELDLFFFQIKVNIALVKVFHDNVDFVLVLEGFPNGD